MEQQAIHVGRVVYVITEDKRIVCKIHGLPSLRLELQCGKVVT